MTLKKTTPLLLVSEIAIFEERQERNCAMDFSLLCFWEGLNKPQCLSIQAAVHSENHTFGEREGGSAALPGNHKQKTKQ